MSAIKIIILMFMLGVLIASVVYYGIGDMGDGTGGVPELHDDSVKEVSATPQDVERLTQEYQKLNCDVVVTEGEPFARAGNSKIQVLIGLCEKRFGGDREKSIPWFEMAASNGEARAATELGIYYIQRAYAEENMELIKKACDYFFMGKNGGDELSENYHMAHHCDVYK